MYIGIYPQRLEPDQPVAAEGRSSLYGGFRSILVGLGEGLLVGGKQKGGREARKPKQDKNKKAKGQTPPPRSATLDAINQAGSSSKG